MKIEQTYKIGYIAKTHGLAGEVTIMKGPDCPELAGIESIFLEVGGSLVPYFVKSISERTDKAFVKFDEVDTIEQASELKGTSLYLPKVDRPKLARGEFYNDEVIGFEVFEGDTSLGHITDIMEAGPNKFLTMDHNGKEVLIPINGPFIKSVNKTKKRVTVDLPEGFLDI